MNAFWAGFKIVGTVLAIVFLVLGLGWIIVTRERQMYDGIESWAHEHEYRAEKIERCNFLKGPFWYADSDTDTVYVSELVRGNETKKAWFRYTPFGLEQKFE
jgi:hypothetical protein